MSAKAAQPKGATRAARTANLILDASLTVISEQGMGRMSMQDVGKAAGVSRASLYRHFPSKADLLAALAARRREEFTERLKQAMPDTTIPEQLLGALTTFFEDFYDQEEPGKFLEREPEFSIAMFRANFPHYMDIYASVVGDEFELITDDQDAVPGAILAELLVRLFVSDILIPSSPQPLFLTRLRPHLRAILGAKPNPETNDSSINSDARFRISGPAPRRR